jgi:hypothetical protein
MVGVIGERGEHVVPNFEVFTGRSSRRGAGPFVTVQRAGVLSLNRDAYQLLGKPEWVELLYDRGASLMGFRAAGTRVPHAYRVRSQKASSSVLVSGGAFTRHYGIPTDVARRYPAALSDGVLVVDLTADAAVATGRDPEEQAAR